MFIGFPCLNSPQNGYITYRMNLDLNSARKKRRPNPNAKGKARSIVSQRMDEYKQRYSISQYTVMLDNKVKGRYMDFCLSNGFSPSNLFALLATQFMDEHEKKSVEA
jgi:hypothetical protein